jgi:hypothetical protein
MPQLRGNEPILGLNTSCGGGGAILRRWGCQGS